MLIKIIFKLYIIYAISVTLHEILHFIVALLFKIKVMGIYLGSDLLRVKIGKFYISPILKDGFVEVELDSLMNKSKFKMYFFYLSGSLANLALILLSGMVGNILIKTWIIIVNFSLLFLSLLPILEDNDGNMMIKLSKSDIYN